MVRMIQSFEALFQSPPDLAPTLCSAPLLKTQNPSSPSMFSSPSQNPKSFISFNIHLPYSSMNAMEFQKNISVSMMHAFGYFSILYRKRSCLYSDFLHNFNGPGLCSAKRILPKGC
nr:hypothetical protein CFP56_41671 [Quercus suber]